MCVDTLFLSVVHAARCLVTLLFNQIYYSLKNLEHSMNEIKGSEIEWKLSKDFWNELPYFSFVFSFMFITINSLDN